ncbi:MAG: sulfotransferase family protein [Anaerolineae bacterium]
MTIKREIFVGGCGRSGTTLLGAILGAHSRCLCPPESHFKTSPFRLGMWKDGHIDPRAAWAYIQIHWRFKIWQLDVDADAAPQSSYVDLLHWLVEQYAEAHDLTGTIWVDHTPENVNYASTLLNHFPRARLVHIVRDGRAVANSIMPLDWGPNTVITAAPWWETNVRSGLTLEEGELAERIVRVKYEALLAEPETTVAHLCDALELAFEPSMLSASGFHPPAYTTRQHQLIGRGLDPARAQRWREALSPRQIEIFESLAGALLQALGYPLLYAENAVPPTPRERLRARTTELWRSKFWNPLRWLKRSYPLWLSSDFLRVVWDSLQASRKANLPPPPET